MIKIPGNFFLIKLFVFPTEDKILVLNKTKKL